jgi:hypothetical protein
VVAVGEALLTTLVALAEVVAAVGGLAAEQAFLGFPLLILIHQVMAGVRIPLEQVPQLLGGLSLPQMLVRLVARRLTLAALV